MVSEDFRKQASGYGLTTAHILYRRPDHRWLLQSFVWQNYDLFPEFPELQRFLAFWIEKLEGPLHSVRVAHCKLIKPAELRMRIENAERGMEEEEEEEDDEDFEDEEDEKDDYDSKMQKKRQGRR